MTQTMAEQLAEHEHAPTATAKETRPPRKVVARVPLWTGDSIISIKIPKGARIIKSRELEKSYLQFPRMVSGGCVNLFVHGEGEKLAKIKGTRVTAWLEVWQKTFDDGCEFLYVDLHPAEGEADSRLLVVSPIDMEKIEIGGETTVCCTPEPLRGYVIIEPIG